MTDKQRPDSIEVSRTLLAPDRTASQQTASRGTVSGRREPDSELCSASGGWGIEPITDGITGGLPVIDLVLSEFRRQLRPPRGFEHHAAVRYRHTMTVNRVVVGREASVAAQVRIEMADKLMAEHVEIDPVARAAALGTAENFRVEASCLRDVPHLNSDMKWGKNHGSPRVR
jgi:hypothetical protein